MKKKFGIWLNKFERNFVPNVRKKTWYRFTTLVLLAPIATLLTFFDSLGKLGRIKRKDKPDIVLKNIVAGFANLAFTDPEIEKLAHHRAEICAKCPFAQAVSGLHTIVVDNKTTHIRGMKCGKCGCALSAKVRSPYDSCPIGKW